jgi:uncharacterized RDD family membrane protein YckC
MESSNSDKHYPALSRRVGSILIDSLFIVLVMFLLTDLFEKLLKTNEENEGLIRAVCFIALWGLYEPIAMTLGGTIGNYIIGIKVRKYSDSDKNINIIQAFGRFIIKMVLGWISFISIGFNKEKRAIHDLATGTLMLEREKK